MRAPGRGTGRGGAATLAVCALALAATAASAAATLPVSQKRRTFEPREATLARGDTLLIVNDDGELLHHAYVSSPAFSFDIGEQEAGRSVPVVFPVAGSFDVLCRIHPRMLLRVTVR